MRCCIHFFLSYAGKKNSGKFLWPALPSDLKNPSWDSETSIACSIPTGQDKSRHSVMSPLLNEWSTPYSPLFWGCSELRSAPFKTPFWFTSRTCLPPNKAQQRFMQCGVLHWVVAAVVHADSCSWQLTLEGIPSYAAEYSYCNVMGNKREIRIIQAHPAASTQA